MGKYQLSLTWDLSIEAKEPGISIGFHRPDGDCEHIHIIDLSFLVDDLIECIQDKDGVIKGADEVAISKRYQELFSDLSERLRRATVLNQRNAAKF